MEKQVQYMKKQLKDGQVYLKDVKKIITQIKNKGK